MIKSAGRAPRLPATKVSIGSGLCVTLVIAACVALTGCNPTGGKSQAPSPEAKAKGVAPVAQTPNPGKPATGGIWDQGRNSDDETMTWDDGLGQHLQFVCADDSFYVEALFSKTVTGKLKTGRLYLGDATNTGLAKVYSGKVEEVQWNNSFSFFVPFTAAFLKDMETAKKMTVAVGESSITPNFPPENDLKAFIAECGGWHKLDAGPAPENLPFPKETVNGPDAAMSAVSSGLPVSAWGFRDTLIGGGYGPEMIALPAGDYIMGSPKTDRKAAIDEVQRPIHIGYSFAVGQYLVTVHDYLTCVAARGCRPPEWKETNRQVDPLAPHDPYADLDLSLGAAANPVVGISWTDAKSYAAWLSRKTGQTYRLLSEAEWEYAARAGTTTIYPWGDKIGVSKANCYGCGSRWDAKATAPVGSFEPNAFGLYDMVGNVEEWVEDCDVPEAHVRPSDGSAFMENGCPVHINRGGSYEGWVGMVRSASRSGHGEDIRDRSLGFRIARTLPHE